MTESENGEGLDLLRLVLTLALQKRLILGLVAVSALLSIIIAFLLPPRYKAQARVVTPSQNRSGVLTAVAELGALAGLGLGDAAGKADLCAGVLKSRSVADVLVARYNLRHVYKVGTEEDARKVLSDRTDIGVDKSGIITIAVSDRDPVRAADMANTYVSELNRNMLRIQTGDAAQNREYFENEAEKARVALIDAENKLREVQEKTGLIDIGAQAQQALGSESTLRARLALEEAQASTMASYMTPNNSALQLARERVVALRNQLRSVRKGGIDDMVGVGQLPEKGLQFVEALREVKYREALYQITLKQMEAARLDELRTTDAVQVVDTATPPQKRASPKRLLIIVLGCLSGLLIGILVALCRAALQRCFEQSDRGLVLEQIRLAVRR